MYLYGLVFGGFAMLLPSRVTQRHYENTLWFPQLPWLQWF